MTSRGRKNQRQQTDVSKWVPKRHPSETLDTAFFRRCHQIEREAINRLGYEKTFNEHSFDSGWALEEIVREAFRELLPKRYSVQAASISDSRGFTAGDCDVAIFNDFWFPVVKAGPTATSRKVYLPIEGVYGVIEVKQALTSRSLEDAMQKLVTCRRLFRPPSPYDRVVENDYRSACTHYISNPLYTSIIAAGLSDGIDMETMVEKFIKINQALPRTDVVNALCVLGHGNVTWGVRSTESSSGLATSLGPATFMTEDRFCELIPVYMPAGEEGSPFYAQAWQLLAHLFQSTLGPENIALYYGRPSDDVKVPTLDGAPLVLPPDPGLLRSLDDLCTEKDTSTDAAHGVIPAVRLPAKHYPHRGPCHLA